MNNTSMRTAGRLTHLKIVHISLVAALAVVSIGIAASPKALDMGAQLEARALMLKAGQPAKWSGSETSRIR